MPSLVLITPAIGTYRQTDTHRVLLCRLTEIRNKLCCMPAVTLTCSSVIRRGTHIVQQSGVFGLRQLEMVVHVVLRTKEIA